MKGLQPKADDTPPDDDPPGPSRVAGDHPEQIPAETDLMHRHDRQCRNVDVRGERRSNKTHVSTTDPDARLYERSSGTSAILCVIGHALMQDCRGLIVRADLIRVDGRAERRAGETMIHAHPPGSSGQLKLSADGGCNAASFMRDLSHAPHRAKIPSFRYRPPHHPTRGLCPVPEAQKADRGVLRMGQDGRRSYADRLPRRQMDGHLLHTEDEAANHLVRLPRLSGA